MAKRIVLPFLVFLVAGLLTWGCGSSSDENPPADGDGATEDGDSSTDGDSDEDGDGPIDGDVPEDGDEDADGEDGDIDEDIPEGSGDQCLFAEDCTGTEDCVENKCVGAKTCLDATECDENQMCWKEDKHGRIGRCRVFCTTDMNCGEDGQCIDGLCEAYTPIPAGPAIPTHEDWDGKLHANFAQGLLEMPMSASMGGYGARAGRNSPYQEAMGGSTGIYDRLTIEALAMDDGSNRVVFVSAPICFPTDFLVSGIVNRVIEMGGPDLRNNLVITGSHTHDGPARFWNILPDLAFGALGFDQFSWEIYQRVVESFAKVVLAANEEEGFRPVRWGYAINENFDPNNKINRDRRDENDDFKDNRLMVMRLDEYREGGWHPWTITLTYATHGTVEGNNDTFITDDAPGGAVNMTQLLYEKNHPGEKINTMFFNGMAGDVSQAGGDLGHRHTQAMQVIGYRVYDKVMELFNYLETGEQPANPDIFVKPMSDTVPIRVVSKRVPIDRDYVGYGPNEFYTVGAAEAPGEPSKPGPFRFGAFQCGLLTSPVEENLDLHVFDASGNLVKESTRTNTGDDGETVRFTPTSAGTYYILVDGFHGAMAGYGLQIVEASRGALPGDPCIDGACGRGCGVCPEFKGMAPAQCDEDAYDSDGAHNDNMENAVSVTVNSSTENLQVCPNNEDWYKIELEADKQVNVTVAWDQNASAYNPETKLEDGRLGCGLVVEDLNGAPMPQFSKTRFTSILLDELYLAGMPGESSSRIGYETVSALEDATDFENIVIFGYTNDHHFYIVTEEDWFQGGYNTNMSIWGFKFGSFLIENLKQLAIAISDGTEQESSNEYPEVKPLVFKDVETPWRTPDTTPISSIGVFAENDKTYQPQDTIRMEQQATFRFIGADPGVDFPRIYLERCINETCSSDSDFENVMRKEGSGRVYDDTYYEFRLEFENELFALPNKPDADPNNYWKVTWEETYSYPVGTYRFRAEGNYYDGTEAQPYTLHSDAFALLPAGIDIQAASASGGIITGSLRYNHAASNDTGDNEFDGVSNKALVLHDPNCEPELGAQVHEDDIDTLTVSIVPQGGGDAVEATGEVTYTETLGNVYFVAARDGEGVETVQSKGNRPLTTFSIDVPDSLSAGSYVATVMVTDVYGNQGVKQISFEVVPD